MKWPVSVCHHVSMIGQFSLPTYLWYHIHASGLIGSPTEPRMLRRLHRVLLGMRLTQLACEL